MKTYYDVHCHVFNKDVIIRKLVNVVQSLLVIKDMVEGEIKAEDLKFKIEGIERTLKDVTQDTSEDVFLVLNKVYGENVTSTPLMFDLTYADDNDDDENENRRYRRRIRRVFKIVILLLPFLRGRIKRKLKNEDLVKSIDQIKKSIEDFYEDFKKKSDEEVEIFDNANYKQQIEDLESLSEKYENVKPFFSVDPRREYKAQVNTIENLKQKLLGTKPKFSGVKLYAPAGFSPTDPVLMGTDNQEGVYELCLKNKIPITVHNSNGGFACLSNILNVRGHVNLNNVVLEMNGPLKFYNRFFSLRLKEVSRAIPERAKILNHPKLWQLVLEKYPELTINFAHFGGSGQIMEYINYGIKHVKIDEDEFEDAILPLSKDDQEIIKAAYTKKRDKMVLSPNLTISERATLWNALYRAGIIDNWAKAIFDLVKNRDYPNAYTDLSCFSEGTIIDTDNDKQVFSIKEELITFKTNFFDKLDDYEKSKILYGSDYYLTQFFGPSMEQYFSDFREAFGDDFDVIASDNPKRFLNL
jgi:predicted TIM-barrel fold metal-dependent hydrolase